MTLPTDEAAEDGPTPEQLLAWFKCRSVGESFNPDDWKAREILFAERDRLLSSLSAAQAVLREAGDVLDDYSDASQEPGDSYPHPNKAMRMRQRILEALGDA